MNDERPSPYPLRMPAELRKTLEKFAKANGRSVNAEIISRLESSVKFENDMLADSSAREFLRDISLAQKEIQKRVQELEANIQSGLIKFPGSEDET